MLFIIFHRKTEDTKVKRFCAAEHIATHSQKMIFETDTWIPPALDSHYYVKTKEGEGGIDIFRKIAVCQHSSTKPPYTYVVDMCDEWSGSVEDTPKEERKPEA